MGQRLFRTGALGSGQAMKALNNLASGGAFLLTLEVLMIGQRSGLDPQLMTEILNVSTGRNNSTDKKIVPHVLSRRFDFGGGLQVSGHRAGLPGRRRAAAVFRPADGRLAPAPHDHA